MCKNVLYEQIISENDLKIRTNRMYDLCNLSLM